MCLKRMRTRNLLLLERNGSQGEEEDRVFVVVGAIPTPLRNQATCHLLLNIGGGSGTYIMRGRL